MSPNLLSQPCDTINLHSHCGSVCGVNKGCVWWRRTVGRGSVCGVNNGCVWWRRTVGRGRVPLPLVGTEEHGEGRVRHVEALWGTGEEKEQKEEH